MRALQVHGFDGWQQWSLDAVAEPEPGPGQLRIAVQTVAPSFVDLLYARGGYQLKPALPFIPGSEFCGVVERCRCCCGNVGKRTIKWMSIELSLQALAV